MNTKKNDKRFEKILDGPLVQSKLDTYEPDEMTVCEKCHRNNPPTRLDCLYCGLDLVVSQEQGSKLKPVLRGIEAHEKGGNLIYLGGLSEWDQNLLDDVSKMIRYDSVLLNEFFGANKALPLARTKLSKEIEVVSERLREMNIRTFVLNDERLELDVPAKRLRGLDFLDDKVLLKLFNTEESVTIESRDVRLIVVGALFERKIASTEKYKKRSENKVLDTAEIMADEAIFDLYVKDDPFGFRVSTRGFDFSCLGTSKQMLASENIGILADKLSAIHSDVEFDDDYLKIRGFLAGMWELDERVDLKGIKRKGFRGFNKESVVISSNRGQFSRYSRLKSHLNNESEK